MFLCFHFLCMWLQNIKNKLVILILPKLTICTLLFSYCIWSAFHYSRRKSYFYFLYCLLKVWITQKYWCWKSNFEMWEGLLIYSIVWNVNCDSLHVKFNWVFWLSFLGKSIVVGKMQWKFCCFWTSEGHYILWTIYTGTVLSLAFFVYGVLMDGKVAVGAKSFTKHDLAWFLSVPGFVNVYSIFL